VRTTQPSHVPLVDGTTSITLRWRVAEQDRLGSSGVFTLIVESARKFKRALTGEEEETELSLEHSELGYQVGRALIAGKLGEVYALGTADFQQRNDRVQFESRWRDTLGSRGTLTGFDVASAGAIELAFIPGLEHVAQEHFRVFIEIAFSTPEIPLDDERAFIIGVVFVDDGGATKLGAIHTR
jgi:hypothetical protein